MAVTMDPLCDDLVAETADLEVVLDRLDDAGWAAPTPAEGWDVCDTVAHLTYFDDRAREAMVDPDGFRAARDAAFSSSSASGASGMVERITREQRRLPRGGTHARFRGARAALLDAARGADPSLRVPWYGPDMSAASSITARIMETWAHGQDVADALALVRAPSDRLRHVAFIGARTMANSYSARGMAVPQSPVRVELRAPSGETWAFGADDADNVVRGPALDFCLVVTQRRHLDDAALELTGAVAKEWMSIAQAFAGPPGSGRRPGQFGA